MGGKLLPDVTWKEVVDLLVVANLASGNGEATAAAVYEAAHP